MSLRSGSTGFYGRRVLKKKVLCLTSPHHDDPCSLYTTQLFQIFDAMTVHGMGIESAAQALTVSRALQREIAQRNVSVVEAIDDLSNKLSLANLVKKGEEPTPSPRVDVAITPLQSEVRIQPLSVAAPLRPKPTTSITASSSATTAKKAKPVNNKNAKQKSKTCASSNNKNAINSARKRPLDDTKQSSDQPQYRQRSDSLSEVVNAKFAENAAKLSSDDDTKMPAVAASAASARSKRTRVTEEGTDHPAKRTRSATTQPKGSTEL